MKTISAKKPAPSSIPVPVQRKAGRLERLIWARGFNMLSLSKASGVPFSTIWNAVRTGKMSTKTVVKLAQALQVSEDELLKS